jgi:hypothetical protein
MSTGFVISAVSAVLQHFLANALSNVSAIFGTVALSSKAPDLVQQEISSGTSLQNQVNLFLHQVTHNPGWRNVALPSLGSNGTTLLSNPPLALDLHYLLTVYGSEDWQAEALLGHAIQMLHRFPVIARADITTALGALPANPFSLRLGASGLADQLEQIKITPSPLNREEMAWLWTALKADYRPTFPFQASVVLIEAETPLSLAFPVLSRSIVANAIQPSLLSQVTPPGQQLAAAVGDTVTVTGEFLKNATQIVLIYPRLGVRLVIPTINITANSVQFVVPPDSVANPCPAGIYTLAANITDAGGNVTQTTNSLPFAVAPVLQLTSLPVAQSATQTTVTATFSPAARPNQKVSLAIGSQSAPAPAFETNQTTLTFTFAPPLTPGKQLARLLVDGSPSQVIVNWPTTPGGIPTFDQSFWVTI